MKNFTQSIDAYKEAVELMPGGVNSPVRAFKSVGMSPVFMESGKEPSLQISMAMIILIMC